MAGRKQKKHSVQPGGSAPAPPPKLNAKKNGNLSFAGRCDKVSIKFNIEAEYKTGLFFRAELESAAPVDAAMLDEVRIAAVGREIWDAYKEERFKQEERAGLAPAPLTLANGATIPSCRSEQKKERRIRPFFIMANGHPRDLEIRQEIKRGRMTTMIKLGNGANDDDPVINRREIEITSHVDEDIGTLLRGLLQADLKAETRKALTFAFNEQSSFVPALQSETMREKCQNVRAPYTDQDGQEYIVVFEPAFDLGAGLTMAGQPWPIREFEGEVKAIYKKDGAVDIKAVPDEAGGYESADIRRISEGVLRAERQFFMDFADAFLQRKTRENPARYGDITTAPIYKSKSRPGLAMIGPLLESGGKKIQKAIAHNQDHGFAVHPKLGG